MVHDVVSLYHDPLVCKNKTVCQPSRVYYVIGFSSLDSEGLKTMTLSTVSYCRYVGWDTSHDMNSCKSTT